MKEILSLKNSFLEIEVKKTGAELCAIRKLPAGADYLWNANPDVWAGTAPVLFPIVGALKEGAYFHQGEKYSLPQHGFFRRSKNIELYSSSDIDLSFRLASCSDTLTDYPFEFEFLLSYTLKENTILIEHEVRNTGNEKMLFSLGGHPAFKCPIDVGEKYSNYFLKFAEVETAHTYHITTDGLIGDEADLILDNSNTINLHSSLFSKGALIFKNIKSRQVSLISRISGERIRVNFEGFPYLGIWAKPNAEFVCIEPWQGIADAVDSDQQLENKEGIIQLEQGENFIASYSIEVF